MVDEKKKDEGLPDDAADHPAAYQGGIEPLLSNPAGPSIVREAEEAHFRAKMAEDALEVVRHEYGIEEDTVDLAKRKAEARAAKVVSDAYHDPDAFQEVVKQMEYLEHLESTSPDPDRDAQDAYFGGHDAYLIEKERQRKIREGELEGDEE